MTAVTGNSSNGHDRSNGCDMKGATAVATGNRSDGSECGDRSGSGDRSGGLNGPQERWRRRQEQWTQRATGAAAATGNSGDSGDRSGGGDGSGCGDRRDGRNGIDVVCWLCGTKKVVTCRNLRLRR